MDYYEVFLHLSYATILFHNKWMDFVIDEEGEEEVIRMTMQTYIIRSFAEELLEKGHDEELIRNALDKFQADEDMYPTGKSYYVRFN